MLNEDHRVNRRKYVCFHVRKNSQICWVFNIKHPYGKRSIISAGFKNLVTLWKKARTHDFGHEIVIMIHLSSSCHLYYLSKGNNLFILDNIVFNQPTLSLTHTLFPHTDSSPDNSSHHPAPCRCIMYCSSDSLTGSLGEKPCIC